jgi:hypothetical protein
MTDNSCTSVNSWFFLRCMSIFIYYLHLCSTIIRNNCNPCDFRRMGYNSCISWWFPVHTWTFWRWASLLVSRSSTRHKWRGVSFYRNVIVNNCQELLHYIAGKSHPFFIFHQEGAYHFLWGWSWSIKYRRRCRGTFKLNCYPFWSLMILIS